MPLPQTQIQADFLTPPEIRTAYKDSLNPLLLRLVHIRTTLNKGSKIEKEAVQMCIFFLSILFDLNSGQMLGPDEHIVGIIESTMEFCEMLENKLGLSTPPEL